MRPRRASSPTSRMMLVSCIARPSRCAYCERRRLRAAEDVGRDLADHAGHQVAVALQRREVEEAGLLAGRSGSRRSRRAGAPARCRRRAASGISACITGWLGWPAKAVSHLAAPPVQLGRGHAGVAHLVDDVVDLAAEGVEGRDRRAPRRRQEEEGVIEATSRCAAALSCTYCCGVMRRASRMRRAPQQHAAASRAPQRRAVRAASRSPCASIFSRMRSPPCTTRRSSQPARPGSRCASGAPSCISARGPGAQVGAPAPRVRRGVARRRAGRRRPTPWRRRSVARHVAAAARQVDAQVLPEVDQLQRAADGVGLRAAPAASSMPYRCSSSRPTGLAERRQ